MTDALLLGLHHALLALAYATGAAAPIVIVAAFARHGVLPLYRRAHRAGVSRRLHREALAAGRTTSQRLTTRPDQWDHLRHWDGESNHDAPTVLDGSEHIATGR